jgi:hypothetical protein
MGSVLDRRPGVPGYGRIRGPNSFVFIASFRGQLRAHLRSTSGPSPRVFLRAGGLRFSRENGMCLNDIGVRNCFENALKTL